MSKKIVLEVSDELAEEIESEYQNRRQDAVESLAEHGWSEQADKLENAEIAENTAERALFILKQEAGE